jgi:hypothetical protein
MTTLLGILLMLAVVATIGAAALLYARRHLRAPACDDRGCTTQRHAREVAHRSAEHRHRLYEEMESIRRGRRDHGT